MKNKKILPIIIAVVIIAVLVAAGYKIYDLMFNGAVQVQLVDVINTVKQCTLQLTVGSIILAAGLVCLIVSRFLKGQGKRYLTAVQGAVAVVMAIVITVTWICMGPLYSIVNTALAGNDEITEFRFERFAEGRNVMEEIGYIPWSFSIPDERHDPAPAGKGTGNRE